LHSSHTLRSTSAPEMSISAGAARRNWRRRIPAPKLAISAEESMRGPARYRPAVSKDLPRSPRKNDTRAVFEQEEQGARGRQGPARPRGLKTSTSSGTGDAAARSGGTPDAARPPAESPEAARGDRQSPQVEEHIKRAKAYGYGYGVAKAQTDSRVAGRGRLVRIPYTNGRKAGSAAFAKLIDRIVPQPGQGSGWDFRGRFLRRNGVYQENDLRSSPEKPIVILECAGPAPKQGQWYGRGAEYVYVLWEWREGAWIELGRAQSVSWEWSLVLRPIAEMVIGSDQAPPRKPSAIDIGVTVKGAISVLDKEAAKLSEEERGQFWAMVHDWIAGRISETLAEPKLVIGEPGLVFEESPEPRLVMGVRELLFE